MGTRIPREPPSQPRQLMTSSIPAPDTAVPEAIGHAADKNVCAAGVMGSHCGRSNEGHRFIQAFTAKKLGHALPFFAEDACPSKSPGA